MGRMPTEEQEEQAEWTSWAGKTGDNRRHKSRLSRLTTNDHRLNPSLSKAHTHDHWAIAASDFLHSLTHSLGLSFLQLHTFSSHLS